MAAASGQSGRAVDGVEVAALVVGVLLEVGVLETTVLETTALDAAEDALAMLELALVPA
jgi:hypothetical protein